MNFFKFTKLIFFQIYFSSNIQFNALTIFADIAASETHAQVKAIVESEAVPHLIKLIYSQEEQICGMAVWALENIMIEAISFRDYCVQLKIIEALIGLVNPNASLELLAKVAWVRSFKF